MAETLAAFKCNFGSTEYFVITMPAERVSKLTIPKDMDGWEDQSLEERFQREINYSRVKKFIAPYLLNDPDRFFNAIVVTALNDDEMEYEPFSNVVKDIPKAYQVSINNVGMLHLSGKEVLVPLDGQHRVAALRMAISGTDNTGNAISGLKSTPEIGKEEVTVILIRNDPKKSRKIFNHINRHAKQVSKSDNLITSEDDYIAVICRQEIASQIIPSRLVSQGNTLSKKDQYFTTLSTVYDISLMVVEDVTKQKPDVSKLPSDEDCAVARDALNEFWECFKTFSAYKSMLNNETEDGDEIRQEYRETNVACKPFSQKAVAKAILELQGRKKASGETFSNSEIIERLDNLDWDNKLDLWDGILMDGARIRSGNNNAMFAGRMIAYILGQNLEEDEISNLNKQYKDVNPKKEFPGTIYTTGS